AAGLPPAGSRAPTAQRRLTEFFSASFASAGRAPVASSKADAARIGARTEWLGFIDSSDPPDTADVRHVRVVYGVCPGAMLGRRSRRLSELLGRVRAGSDTKTSSPRGCGPTRGSAASTRRGC